ASEAMLTIAAAPPSQPSPSERAAGGQGELIRPSTAPLVTRLELVSRMSRSTTPLVTTLELVSHDRPAISAPIQSAPPAPLPVSAAQKSVPIGPLAAANGQPVSRPSVAGPDLGMASSQDATGLPVSSESAKDARTVTPPAILTAPPSPAIEHS